MTRLDARRQKNIDPSQHQKYSAWMTNTHMCNTRSKIIIVTRTNEPKIWKNNKNTAAQPKLSGSFCEKPYKFTYQN